MNCHAQSDLVSSAARYEPREESGVDTAGRSYGPYPLECLLVANADCDLRSGSLHNLSNSETLRIITRKGRHEIGLIPSSSQEHGRWRSIWSSASLSACDLARVLGPFPGLLSYSG
jgi:hypothetical protein